MAFTPSTDIYLCDVPFDSSYKHTLTFANAAVQNTYFVSKIKHSYLNVTYQRKDSMIRVNAELDTLWDVNYVFYQNENFGNKWFYAFITKMEYVNASTTNVYIETDVIQSWMFDVTFKPSFVIREHVGNDAIGEHRVDEGLELGEYVYSSPSKIGNLGDRWGVIAVSDTTPFGAAATIGNVYGMVPSGLAFYPFPLDSTGAAWLNNTIQNFAAVGKVEAIQMIFTVPELAIRGTVGVGGWILGYPINNFYNPILEAFTKPKPATLECGYAPKNNKLFTDPYRFFYVTNSTGGAAKFALEEFGTDNVTFNVTSGLGPNPMSLLIPTNYKAMSSAHDYALTLDGFPVGSWTSDTYTAWFAQNGVGVGIGMAIGVGTAIAGVATANPVMAMGGAMGVFNQLMTMRQASIQPDQAKGQTGAGSVRYSINNLDFYYSFASVNAYFAKIIDDYFTMFGYKVNALKVPNIMTRSKWNYIQTIDAAIIGGVPQDDLARYKKALNDGITFWHSGATFLDYNQSNTII